MKRHIFTSVLIILLVCALAIFRDSGYKYSGRIFADIDELRMLDAYITADASDPNLGALVPTEHYCKTILFDRAEYLVCAYIFADAADSLQYYQNVWGSAFTQPQNWWIRSASSPQHTEYMAFRENCVLYFRAAVPHKHAVAFENMLTESFSTALRAS